MEMILFVGLQGSGKSSFYLQEFSTTHLRINLDMLRTRKRETAIFEACLRSGQRMVIDNTNPASSDRSHYLAKAIEKHFTPVAYYFDVAYELCHSRNALRTGKEQVPEKGLKAVASKLEKPLLIEGFKSIYYVDENATATLIEEAQK